MHTRGDTTVVRREFLSLSLSLSLKRAAFNKSTSWRTFVAPGAEPGNRDDLVFMVGPSRDVTDWFYTPRVCERIPALRSDVQART